MKFRKKTLLVLSVFLFFGCKSIPEITTFFVSPGVNQYFIPHNKWTAGNSKKIYAMMDFTYRTNSENPVFINFSFYNREENPRKISAARFEGGGVSYTLENIKTLYINSKKHEVRVTTEGRWEDFLSMIGSADIALRATVDGVEYAYTPGKDFQVLRDQFFADLIVE
jgi:hypothetical protein